MIPVRQVHELVIGSSDRDEHPAHISAASSLVRHAGSLYVVADDELSLAIFDAHDLGDGHLIDILPGELPENPDERKEEKPDLESLTLLPPFGELPNGALLAVGSGSSEKRLRGALVPLDAGGRPGAAPRAIDLSELYEGLGREVKDLNIEGCAALDDRFYLAQRGNGRGGEDALIAVAWEPLAQALLRGGTPDVDAVEEIRRYDLGQIRGVDLSFSDLSPIEDGRLAFSSSAEDSSGTITDGEIFGSALGVLRPGGDIDFHEPVDGIVKIEGIDARLGDDGLEILIVMDADDPSKPSPLLGATII